MGWCVSAGLVRGQQVEWFATNLYKSDRIFFLGLNNAIPIKELGHCSAYGSRVFELTQ